MYVIGFATALTASSDSKLHKNLQSYSHLQSPLQASPELKSLWWHCCKMSLSLRSAEFQPELLFIYYQALPKPPSVNLDLKELPSSLYTARNSRTLLQLSSGTWGAHVET